MKLHWYFIGLLALFVGFVPMFSQENAKGVIKNWKLDKGFGEVHLYIQGQTIQSNKMLNPLLHYLNVTLNSKLTDYDRKIQQIFMENREKKISLDKKRLELMKKQRELCSRYVTNKIVKKELILVIKEMEVVQTNILAINNEAMEKIRILNNERDIEIQKSIVEWIEKLEKDDEEFEKYINYMNSLPEFK